MASIFFRLRLVPEDEAEDVRQLLDDNNIPWFETSAGKWGISFPAIWLHEDEDRARANELLQAYQLQLQANQRARQQDRIQRGEQETVITRLCRRPISSLLALVVIGVIIFFSTRPFFNVLPG